MGLWITPWSSGSHHGAVDRSMGLWIAPWGCGSLHGAVVHTMGLWFIPWGCRSLHGAVDHSMELWFTPWGCGSLHGAVDHSMGLWILHGAAWQALIRLGEPWGRSQHPQGVPGSPAVPVATFSSLLQCSLHIHASYSISQKLNVPMAPLSEPNAVGIVIAHGSVGGAISVMPPDVYISDDGGYTWARMLEGPHHYSILDSGGLIVAVKHSSQPINAIEFSTDEGQCWYRYLFSKEPIFFTGLASEPGARSMTVSVWGFRGSFFRKWVSYTIDFSELLSRTCEDKDYTIWLAHSSDPGDPSDGCILGYKEQYRRLRKSSVCRNGRDYVVTKQPSVCPCTLQDFLCDFGYYRPENQSVCVEQPELKGHDLEFCLYGRRELLRTSGYRKIPGDQCSGGESPAREETDLKKKCTSNLLSPSPLAAPRSPAAAVLAVGTALLLTAAIAGLLVKKYVCGGRFLVQRYSVLQQHAEANDAETIDALGPPAPAKPGYHDDSDEDLLE
uniref:Sortilin 1 n=1 Tax=Amazona collaria TaxID=241587 RepID=A0A8B9FSX6_9PSIT